MTCTGAHPDCYTGGPRCPCAHPPSSWGSIAWPSIKAPPVEPDAHDRRDHDPGDEDEPRCRAPRRATWFDGPIATLPPRRPHITPAMLPEAS